MTSTQLPALLVPDRWIWLDRADEPEVRREVGEYSLEIDSETDLDRAITAILAVVTAAGAGVRVGISLDALLRHGRLLAISEYWPSITVAERTQPASAVLVSYFLKTYGTAPDDDALLETGGGLAFRHINDGLDESQQIDYWVCTPDDSSFTVLSFTHSGTDYPIDDTRAACDAIFSTLYWVETASDEAVDEAVATPAAS